MYQSNIITKDEVTTAQSVIMSDHVGIHESKGFSISGIFTNVANAAVVNYAFKTPAAGGKKIHLKFKDILATANKIRVDLNEAPTNAPTNGTDLTPYNRNRVGTPVVSAMQAVKTGMTIDLTGVKVIDSTQFIGGVSRPLELEWILKPDTWYIRTFTNSTGGAADISFIEFWYEE